MDAFTDQLDSQYERARPDEKSSSFARKRWQAPAGVSSSDPLCSLEDGDDGKTWDQFIANAQLHNVHSTYNPDMYTIPVPRDAPSVDERAAIPIEKEVAKTERSSDLAVESEGCEVASALGAKAPTAERENDSSARAQKSEPVKKATATYASVVAAPVVASSSRSAGDEKASSKATSTAPPDVKSKSVGTPSSEGPLSSSAALPRPPPPPPSSGASAATERPTRTRFDLSAPEYSPASSSPRPKFDLGAAEFFPSSPAAPPLASAVPPPRPFRSGLNPLAAAKTLQDILHDAFEQLRRAEEASDSKKTLDVSNWPFGASTMRPAVVDESSMHFAEMSRRGPPVLPAMPSPPGMAYPAPVWGPPGYPVMPTMMSLPPGYMVPPPGVMGPEGRPPPTVGMPPFDLQGIADPRRSLGTRRE